MGKLSNTDQWRKFKHSFLQLSVSDRPLADHRETVEIEHPDSDESATNLSSLADTEFDTDRESTPLFSSTSTLDLNIHPSAWGNSEVVSLAPSYSSSCDDFDNAGPSEVPPRSGQRDSCGSLPPRRHPYPADLSSNLKTYQKATSPSGFRRLFFNRVSSRRSSVVYPKRISGCSLTPPAKPRGFKGMSIRLRRVFTFNRFRRKRKSRIFAKEDDDSQEGLGVALLTLPAEEPAPAENLYSRVLKAAMDLDLDESTVGSLIMIMSDETMVQSMA